MLTKHKVTQVLSSDFKKTPVYFNWKFLIYWYAITGLKVSDQMVAHATKFLVVRLKNHVWSHSRALKAQVQCD